MKKKFLCLKNKTANGFSKMKKKINTQKLKKLKLNRKSFLLSALVVSSIFGSPFLIPAFAQELSSSEASKYAELFSSKKRSFRDYLSFQRMLAELPGKSPSAMLGIIAAELTYQILRALGIVAAIQATRMAAIRIPDAYLAFSLFALRMSKNRPSEDELFSEVIDGVTNAF